MNLNSPPSWLFISNKGKTREQNKDMYALIHNEDATLIIAFDISTSSPATTEITEMFVNEVESGLASSSPSQVSDVEQQLHLAFNKVKSEFKVGKASVLVFFFLHQQVTMSCLHAGDVRLGQYSEGKAIQWITNVHTGANALGQFFEDSMLQDESRHVVTRCLNLQRNLNLEKTEFEITESQLIIASDGFWAECPNEEQQSIIQGKQPSTEDDCTVLVLTWDKENALPNNHAANLIVKQCQ
ncbi:PP2C family protein-serine/threonine phosphatase [Vibrio alginolyticus]|uniref:PP2C family protein-serine/threonine phosphatase n=1 Tax=Vibrio alginolyticus TaxID=663 RepID=UPI0036F441D0